MDPGKKRRKSALPHDPGEQILARAFHAGPVCMAVSTREARCLGVNDSFAAYFGYTPQEMAGRTLLDLGILRDSRDAEEIRLIFGDSRSIHDREIALRTREGSPRDALMSVDSIAIQGDTLRLTVLTDITARRQAERSAVTRNQALELQSYVRQALVRVRQPHAVYERICSSAVEKAGFPLAWIGLLGSAPGTLTVAASAGMAGSLLSIPHSFDSAAPAGPVPWTRSCARDCGR